MKNYYRILGVSVQSSEAEIKAAFRRIALATHPDKTGGDAASTETFSKASIAYAALVGRANIAAYRKQLRAVGIACDACGGQGLVGRKLPRPVCQKCGGSGVYFEEN